MRIVHFEALSPVCLRCRHDRGIESPLRLGPVAREDATGIVQGLLLCSDRDCGLPAPIVDGIPWLFYDLAAFVREQAHLLLARSDLGDDVLAVVYDALAADPAWSAAHAIEAGYAFSHWGDRLLDPPPAPEGLGPATIVGLLDAMWTRAPLPGPVLDVGCGPGRALFEASLRAPGWPALGVDRNVGLLRLARRTLLEGGADVPIRRGGTFVERRAIEPLVGIAQDLDFWAADAADLPFPRGTFARVLSLNVLDSVPDPAAHVADLAAALRIGGDLLLTSPFSWSAHATSPSRWLGGQGVRGGEAASGPAVLKALVAAGEGLRLVEEHDGLRWALRDDDRSGTVRRCWGGRFLRAAPGE